MIYYHGTPVGGKRNEAAQFLSGRDALVSYARPEDISTAADVCRSVLLDNGAFTTWKQGKQFDLVGYYAWCRSWLRHPNVHWAIIPDVIDGTEKENDQLLRAWPRQLQGIPVWHYAESLVRLSRLVREYPWVSLGSSGDFSSPGSHKWWERTEQVMRVACDSEGRPRCKLHGLRMLSRKILERVPLASADSTNCVRNASSLSRYGMYIPPTRVQRMVVLADRIEICSPPPVYQFQKSV